MSNYSPRILTIGHLYAFYLKQNTQIGYKLEACEQAPHEHEEVSLDYVTIGH